MCMESIHRKICWNPAGYGFSSVRCRVLGKVTERGSGHGITGLTRTVNLDGYVCTIGWGFSLYCRNSDSFYPGLLTGLVLFVEQWRTGHYYDPVLSCPIGLTIILSCPVNKFQIWILPRDNPSNPVGRSCTIFGYIQTHFSQKRHCGLIRMH